MNDQVKKIVVTKDEARHIASRLQATFAKRGYPGLRRCVCLEITAEILGYKDWQTLVKLLTS